MNMKRALVVCVTLMSVLTLFIACLDNKKSTNVSTDTGTVRDELVVVSTSEPKYINNLTPGQTDLYETFIYSQIYDPLFIKDWDQGGKVIPYLAESYEMSPDGLQIKIKMRDNVYFHDGSKLTTDDVKFTLDLMKTRPLGIALLINVDTVEIVDELNLIIHMVAPYGPIMNALSSRLNYISSKSYWEKVGGFDGYNTDPIGTGPYKFVSATSGDSYRMERNENYWNGKAAFKKFTLKIVSDVNTAVLSVESGDADAAVNIPLDSLININNPDVAWDSASSFLMCNFRFNFLPNNWVARDRNFRKAVQYAIDKHAINEGVYYGRTKEVEVYGDDTWTGKPVAGTYHTYSYDPAKAREYLRVSNYDGREFRVVTWAGSSLEKAAQIIQADLKDVGISMKIVAVDPPTYWDIVRNTGDFDVKYVGSGASTLDMDGLNYYLLNMYDNKNEVHPRGQELNDLIIAGRLDPNPEKRSEIYGRLFDILVDEAIIIVTHEEVNTVLYRKGLKNVKAEYMMIIGRLFDWTY